MKARSVTSLGEGIVATGDFRGAGVSQLAVLDDPKQDLSLRITLADTPGSATAATWFSSGPQFLSLQRAKVAVMDVDGDAKDDLVLLYNAGSDTTRLLVFRSTGTAFTYANAWWSGDLDWARSRYVAGGRFGGSADSLLVAYQEDGDQLRVLSFAIDAGTFAAPRTVYTSRPGEFDLAATRFAAGHFAHPSAPDELVALTQAGAKAKIVLFEPGPAGFGRSDAYQTDFDYDVTKVMLGAGDVSGDGREQLLALSTDEHGAAAVRVFDGGAGFTPKGAGIDWAELPAGAVCAGPGSLAIGDWDRDGRADAAVISPSIAAADGGPGLRAHLLRSTGSGFSVTQGAGGLACPVWPLNGLPLGFGDATKRPLYVKTDNNPNARPHYGISKADMVYEWLVEGLTTRLAAVYQSQHPETIGSVRSVRMTDRHVLPSLDAALVYSGGGPEELMAIHYDAAVAGRYVDLSPNYGWGYRVDFRHSPYNFFTSYSAVEDALASAPDGDQPAIVAPWRFLPTADGEPTAGGFGSSVAATQITVPYRALFGVSYAYDAASRTYARYDDGVREVDAANNVAIAAKNIVVIQTEVHFTTDFGLDPAGNPKLEEVLTGSGKGSVFRDGRREDVTWSRADVVDAFTLTNASGERVLLAPGQTWIHVVPNDWTIPSQ